MLARQTRLPRTSVGGIVRSLAAMLRSEVTASSVGGGVESTSTGKTRLGGVGCAGVTAVFIDSGSCTSSASPYGVAPLSTRLTSTRKSCVVAPLLGAVTALASTLPGTELHAGAVASAGSLAVEHRCTVA